jgi:membrane-bound metal-dependent hydrolase YbcI (DUF457 family)
MDSMTHCLTGALVCDAIPYTKRLGPKAPLVAAILGAAPDLDMVPAFLANFPPRQFSFHGLFDMDTVARFHRAYSHSFFYMTLAAIPLAWLAWRWSGRKGAVRHWLFLIIPALYSHTILDLTNPWGVRAWLPFSNSRSAFNVLPLYDPFIISVTAAVFLINHAFRESYPEDPPGPVVYKQRWRERTAAFLDRVARPTTVGVIGLILVAVHVAYAILSSSNLRGWF